MKLKAFLDLVEKKHSIVPGQDTVELELTLQDVLELRQDCAANGWQSVSMHDELALRRTHRTGDVIRLDSATIAIVGEPKAADPEPPKLSKWWHIHPTKKPLAYVINRVHVHVDLDARVHGTEPEKIEITKTSDGWQAIGYGQPRNTAAVEAGVAEDQEDAEMLAEGAKRVAASADGERGSWLVGSINVDINSNVTRTIDDETAERLAEAIRRRADPESDDDWVEGPEDDPNANADHQDIWEMMTERIEEAVRERMPDVAMKYVDLARSLREKSFQGYSIADFLGLD